MNEYQKQLRASVTHLHRAIYEMGSALGHLNGVKNEASRMVPKDLPSVSELTTMEVSSQDINSLMRFSMMIRDVLSNHRHQLGEDEILEYMGRIINVHTDDFGDIDVTALAEDTCNWFRDYDYNVLDARVPEIYMILATNLYDENVGDDNAERY
jgi:hypothetical protein